MATYEHNALMQYIDETGNMHINYPATKAENVMLGNSDAQTEITARAKTSDILYTLEEISACTDFTNKISGAEAVNKVNSSLGEHSFSDWINVGQGVSYRYNKQLLEVIIENGTQNFGQWYTLANLPIKPSKISHTLGWNYAGDVVVGITITTNGDVNVRTLGGNQTIGATGHIICSR